MLMSKNVNNNVSKDSPISFGCWLPFAGMPESLQFFTVFLQYWKMSPNKAPRFFFIV